MVSEWQKKYEIEARELIRKSREEYKHMVKMSNITASQRCECGFHTTDEKLRFCKNCRRSFCHEHGDMEKSVCHKCGELNGKEKI